MKKKITVLLLCLAMLVTIIPTGIASIPAAATGGDGTYKTENVEVPEGWDYVEVSTVDELEQSTRRHNGWSTDGQPLFVRLTKDLEIDNTKTEKYDRALIQLNYWTSTIIDLNGHKITGFIVADKNGDNHTWYCLYIILNYGLVPDYTFRIVDSVGGGKIYLHAHTDVDGPTTAVMIQGFSLYTPGWSTGTPDDAPYYKDGADVYIDGGAFQLWTKNEKFCGVQGGPLHDSNGLARWESGVYTPYARSAIAFEKCRVTVNNGHFYTQMDPNQPEIPADMGRRFLSDLGLADSYSAGHLKINGGLFDGHAYSVLWYNIHTEAADGYALTVFPQINGGQFKGGIQFCTSRMSFWKKLEDCYELNKEMKDIKVSKILYPGAKMYMDGKLIDPDVKDLEDIAWPHDIKIEPGPQILNTKLVNKALAANGYTKFLIQYNKAPDKLPDSELLSVELQEYITVIRHGEPMSYWTEAEGSYYTLTSGLGENYYNLHIPAKTEAAIGKFRVKATFEGKALYSDEFEVQWVDFSDFYFSQGPVWKDGNGAGVAHVDFDVSHSDLVTKYALCWFNHGDYWSEVEDAPHLTQDYNKGLYRFYIPELADKNSDHTEYRISVTYTVDGVTRTIDSDPFTLTEADLGAPMDPYSVGLDCIECVLAVGEIKAIDVTLFPTAVPHKEGFEATSSDPGVANVSGMGENYFTIRGNSEGVATITVTAVGGAFAECKVTVFDSSFLPGDVNGDGEVDNKDVVTLFRYLSGTDVTVNTVALDTNGDGEVDNKDVVVLFRYLSGADVTLSGIPYTPNK